MEHLVRIKLTIVFKPSSHYYTIEVSWFCIGIQDSNYLQYHLFLSGRLFNFWADSSLPNLLVIFIYFFLFFFFFFFFFFAESSTFSMISLNGSFIIYF